jgi:L-lactate dehydrogenase complex protein LldG
MSARDDILARIRKANARVVSGAADPPHPIPAIARGTPDALIDRFTKRAALAGATITRIDRLAQLPGAVVEFLEREQVPRVIAFSHDSFAALDWQATGIAARCGPTEAADIVSLTPAVAGIAETGSVLVASGPGTPQLRHFLPEIHIAALAADRVVGGYEEGWAILRAEAARVHNGVMPRAATLITGPSRTSDIERTLQIGVHGPRRLHIVLFTSQ